MKWTSRIVLLMCLAILVLGSASRPRVVEARIIGTNRTAVVLVSSDEPDPAVDGLWGRVRKWWSSRFGAKPAILRGTGTNA